MERSQDRKVGRNQVKSLKASILNFQRMRTKLNGQGNRERVNLEEEDWLFFLQKGDYHLGVKVRKV